jgi:steroid delta-isomerase
VAASKDVILETIRAYVDHIGAGAVDKVVALFAENATVEDPVGTEVRTTPESIREFYTVIDGAAQSATLGLVKVSGGQAAFSFDLHMKRGDRSYTISPIDVMTFDDDGRITSMRAFWSDTDLVAA